MRVRAEDPKEGPDLFVIEERGQVGGRGRDPQPVLQQPEAGPAQPAAQHVALALGRSWEVKAQQHPADIGVLADRGGPPCQAGSLPQDPAGALGEPVAGCAPGPLAGQQVPGDHPVQGAPDGGLADPRPGAQRDGRRGRDGGLGGRPASCGART